AALFHAFPDAEMMQEGEAFGTDVLVAWGVFHGTMRGPFFGVAPTGRRIAIPFVNVVPFRDGLMLGERAYFDLATLCAQAGLALDFGLVKRGATALCEELDERVLLPERSDCLVVTRTEDAVEVRTEAGHRFRFPAADVRLLPIAHSSAEELAAYLLARLREALRGEVGGRGLAALEVGVAEAPGQAAYCRETC